MQIDLRDLSNVFDTSKCSNPIIDTRKIYFDSRFPMKEGIFFPITGERFDGEDFISVSGKIRIPYFFSRQEFSEKDYIRILIPNNEALQELAKFIRMGFKGVAIGITGTSGKTTLKEILSTILSSKFNVHHSRGNFNNLIGLPMSILALEGDEEFGVFELGTNQPGEIRALSKILKPDVSFITSIGRGHTEFLVDEEGVFLEKQSIISETRKAFFTSCSGNYGNRLMEFSRKHKIMAVNLEDVPRISDINLECGTEIEFLNEDNTKFYIRTLLFGDGNISNFLLGVCACNVMGWLDMDEIRESAKLIQGEKNRLFPRIAGNGVYFIDDSYNSNPLSLKNGILFLCQLNIPVKYAVIGDMMEINDHDMQYSSDEICEILSLNKENTNLNLIFYGNKIEYMYKQFKAKNIDNISFFQKNYENQKLIESIKFDINSKSGDKVIYFKASRSACIEKVMEDLTSALFPV
ncbi:UDP-N-acetylmuramoyl-tripeptide--D-alanyl-D-alanine ligase [bacterium]|nr:UDP-N-acetylmuramoyl-tripeptide--D-alanyl-D-alanine ligase [bacterium]